MLQFYFLSIVANLLAGIDAFLRLDRQKVFRAYGRAFRVLGPRGENGARPGFSSRGIRNTFCSAEPPLVFGDLFHP